MSADTIDEAMLFAYLDGELDAAQRAEVEAAVARDPKLAAMLAGQQQLKALLQARFDAVLDEPVPDRLLHAARAPASATVVELRPARESAPPRWAWREWGAVAATLVVGLLVGLNLPHGAGGAALIASTDGWMASGPLAAALSDQPAGVVGHGKARIDFSMRTVTGELCRSFTLDSGAAGLACRRKDRWMIDVLASAEPGSATGSFRQAATTMPEALRSSIEQRMVGEPLTEAEEREQIGRQWRGSASSVVTP